MVDSAQTAAPLDAALARVRSRSAGRTRYEGQKPHDDEIMLLEIEGLRAENAALEDKLDRYDPTWRNR